MPTVTLYDMKGNQAGELDLAADVFAAPYNEALLHQVYLAQRANRRRGTHSTKTRGEVSGGGRKPWRQKGTGMSRHGSRRSPIWKGGGITFGPKPRSYTQAIPKKMRRLAMRSALSQRLRESKLTALAELALDEYRTKAIVGMLGALEVGERSILMVLSERDHKIEKSAANVPGLTVVRAEDLNLIDVVHHERVVATQDALKRIQEVLS